MIGLALALSLFAAVGAEYPTPVEHDFVLHDYRFRNGETLQEVRIHYVTVGTPPRAAAPHQAAAPHSAVLVLHGTGGSLEQFINDRFAGVLFKQGGVLDASRYFIVIPDNIGHGQSSKPSDGLGKRFPHYDYDDMVDLQHRLLSEGLGIDHLSMVIGTSMGAMHTWMWGEKYPQMTDALVPLASLPTAIAGRNRVWRKMMIDDLERNDLQAALQILLLVGSAPFQWQKTAPTRDAADQWLAEQMKSRLASSSADDLLYALESSRNYDPSPDLERIAAPLLAINSADDFINPQELGIMETLIRRVKHGRYVLIPASDQTHGHGTHTWAAVWEKELDHFLKFEYRSVSVNGKEYPYAVSVPRSGNGALPVILFLHGAGERGDDGFRQTDVGLGRAMPPNAIGVFPQAPTETRWIGDPADAAMKALDASVAEFNGDPERLYLTGVSMGGYGVWHLALANPDHVAALVPVCGGLLPHATTTSVQRSPLTDDVADPYAFVAHALRHLPIWIFHGAADSVIPVTESRQMADALRKEGADVRYTEYPGVDHNAWDRAYAEEELWKWLFAQSRHSQIAP